MDEEVALAALGGRRRALRASTHRPGRSPWTGSARGLSRGSIYTRDGQLAVSVVQEGLLRTPR